MINAFAAQIPKAEIKPFQVFDFILSTVPANIDVDHYISLVRPEGTLCIVGAMPYPLSLRSISLVLGNKSLVGSMIGSPSIIREMLAVAAEKNIRAKTELVSIADVNDAIAKVREGKARYRVVLKL